MKRISYGCMVVVWALSLGTLGCDAFSDRNEEYEVLSRMHLVPGDNGGEEVPAAPSGSATVCKALPGITVTSSSTPSIRSNSGWSATGTVQAKAVADDATSITVAGDEAVLSFVVQKTDEKTFAVCSVSYVPAETTAAKHAGESHATAASGTFAVTTGSLMVDQFNVKSGDGSKVVNAGSYQFAFKKEAAAAKAAAVLLGAKAEAAGDLVTVEGVYFTERLEAAAQ